MRWLLILCVCAQGAAAQAFDPTYQVTDVAEDDRLNIRMTPDAGSEIIDSLGPFAINVEVLETSPDGKWGLVGAGERNGWVSMRYLTPSQVQNPDALPRPLHCFGTEPFWSLRALPDGDAYQEMGDTPRALTLTDERIASNGAMATFAEGPTQVRTLIIKRGQCGDGMSDRTFALQATLFNDTFDRSTVQTGCCTLDGR